MYMGVGGIWEPLPNSLASTAPPGEPTPGVFTIVPVGAFISGQGVKGTNLGYATFGAFDRDISIDMQVLVMSKSAAAGSILSCASDGQLFKLTTGEGDKLDWVTGNQQVWSGSTPVSTTKRSHIAITVAKDGTLHVYLNGGLEIDINLTPFSSGEVSCYLSYDGMQTIVSSLTVYDGVKTPTAVYGAYSHCAEEPSPEPAPAPAPATEEQGMSASTGIAVFVAAFVYVGLTAALVATCTVAASFGHFKRN